MINRYIKTMGVELEGGWLVNPPDRRLHGDGSIRCDSLRSAGATVIGEISSPPFDRMSQFGEWLVKNHPDFTNDSCGLHVHLALEPMNYARLMDDSFKAFFLAKMREYERENIESLPDTFINRLHGYNRYCLPDYQPEIQVVQTGREACRYGFWNFCYNIHKTTECRLMPMFDDPAASLHAIKTVIDSVTAFLRGKPEMVKIDINLAAADLELMAINGADTDGLQVF